MRKVQFFLLLESLMMALAFFTTIASESARFLLLLALVLLLIRYLVRSRGLDFYLVSVGILLFLVFALNIYFIIGVLLALVYLTVNFFSRYEKRNRYIHVLLDDEPLVVHHKKTQWFGQQQHTQDSAGFSDVNVSRLFGNDIIDLDEAIVTGRDHVIWIRKSFGRTKIIVPIDVEVALSTSSLYGSVRFLGLSQWDLRNESLTLVSPQYNAAHKRVKIVLNCLLGDVEVVRV